MLKKNLKNNKDRFDDQELPDGHLARFEALLDKQDSTRKGRKSAKRISISIWFSSVASVAIIVIASVYFYTKGFTDTNSNAPAQIEEKNEFYVTNEFYKQQMDEQIADIMCKLDQADTQTRHALSKDIQQVLKENELFINEIKNNQNEESAIYYMVQHYNTNIQALEFINDRLGKHIQC